MDPLFLILILVTASLVLLVGDLFVPSGGIMSVVGVGLLLTAVFVCFTINRWLGLATLFGVTVASPFVAAGLLRAWKRTPVGKALLLGDQHVIARPTSPVVRVGTVGQTLSALRPMGEAEFDVTGVPTAVQAKSEHGDVPAGTDVRVIHFKDGVATVRRTEPATASAPAPDPTADVT